MLYSIHSTPSDARVYIDGNYLGNTTTYWRPDAGTYDIKFIKSNYNNKTISFKVIEGASFEVIEVTLTQREEEDEEEEDEDDEEDEDEEEDVIEGETPTPPPEEPPKEESQFTKEQQEVIDESILDNIKRGMPKSFTQLAADIAMALGLGAGGAILVQASKSFLASFGFVGSGGLATGLGIAGMSIPKATEKLAVRGAMGIAGFDGIMVWMASDNVLTGTAFTLRKLREAVKAGALTQKEALKETELVQVWITRARKLVETSVALNPFIMPFGGILLINADKSQKDFDLEVKLIKKTFPKK